MKLVKKGVKTEKRWGFTNYGFRFTKEIKEIEAENHGVWTNWQKNDGY